MGEPTVVAAPAHGDGPQGVRRLTAIGRYALSLATPIWLLAGLWLVYRAPLPHLWWWPWPWPWAGVAYSAVSLVPLGACRPRPHATAPHQVNGGWWWWLWWLAAGAWLLYAALVGYVVLGPNLGYLFAAATLIGVIYYLLVVVPRQQATAAERAAERRSGAVGGPDAPGRRRVRAVDKPEISAETRFQIENEARRTAAQALGGLALICGLLFSWQTLQKDRQGQLTDRYIKAVDLLGRTDSPGSQVGGVCALVQITRDVPSYLGIVEEVLATTFCERRAEAARRTAVAQPLSPVEHAILCALLRSEDSVHARRLQPAPPQVPGSTWPVRLELKGADLRGADLRGPEWNWNDVDLTGATLEHADLSGANLGLAVLDGACLAHADLSDSFFFPDRGPVDRPEQARANDVLLFCLRFIPGGPGVTNWALTLRRADPPRADPEDDPRNHSTLNRTDLRGAKLRSARLTHAKLDAVRLDGADLYNASFRGARASGTSFARANLADADLSQARLQRVDLTGADLARADLSGADLRETTGLTKQMLASARTTQGALRPPGL